MASRNAFVSVAAKADRFLAASRAELLKLGTASQVDRFLEAAIKARYFDDDYYNSYANEEDVVTHFMGNWCKHGRL